MTEYRLVVTYAGNGEFCYEIRELNIRADKIEFAPNNSIWVDWDADFAGGVAALRQAFEDAVAKPPVFREYDRDAGLFILKEGK
jgi:hypothetical protein